MTLDAKFNVWNIFPPWMKTVVKKFIHTQCFLKKGEKNINHDKQAKMNHEEKKV